MNKLKYPSRLKKLACFFGYHTLVNQNDRAPCGMSFYQVPMATHGMKQYLHVLRCTECNAVKAYVGTNYWSSHDAMFKRKATSEETKLGIETLKKMSQRRNLLSTNSESY